MGILSSVVLFIVLFSFLVLIHEWGHFIVARRNGVKVEEFSLGLPPRAKKIYTDSKGTVYSIGWVPFGGYVRMFGEDDASGESEGVKGSFAAQSRWARSKIVMAGVVINYLFALFALWFLFVVGTQPIVLPGDFDRYVAEGVITTEPGILITAVVEGGIADTAGFEGGDIIVAMNGELTDSASDIIAVSKDLSGSEVEYRVKRGEELLVLPAVLSDEGTIGVQISNGPVVGEVLEVKYGVVKAFRIAAYESTRLIGATAIAFIDVIKQMFTSADLPDGVAGPVGIAAMTHDVAAKGFKSILKFAALLSVSLAAINALPIPALDGGRFLFVLVEAVRNKRADAAWEARIHALGFLLLISLILFVTYKDILNLLN